MMIHTDDIRKLSDFRQNAKAHLDRLAETARVEVLTVNGEAKGVVMAPQVYEALMEEVELARSLAMLDKGVEDVKAGRGKSLKQTVRDLANELGLQLNQ